MRSLILLFLLAAPAPVSATVSAPVSPARQAELERLVRQDCGSCHGMTLKGGLGPDIRGPSLRALPPETIAKIILDGVAGSAMPPWRPLLSKGDVGWIVNYLLETK